MNNLLQPFVYADKSKCIGCRSCEVACSSVHSGKMGQTVGSIQGEIMPRLFFVHTENENMPIQCHHCEAAPCLKSCASGAISIVDQQVIVAETACTGCKSCIAACPFGVIEMLQTKKQGSFAGKCDVCRHREEGPACIEVCPEKALRYVDPASEAQKKRIAAVQALTALSPSFVR